MTVLRRELRINKFPVRVRSDNGRTTVEGYAARFNELSLDLGGFREKIDPGAFADALKNDDVRALFNHNPDHVMGRLGAGTLRLYEDKEGLYYVIEPDLRQSSIADFVHKIERGDVFGSSFGFRMRWEDEDWSDGSEGVVVRTIKRVESLRDVGPVTFAAYPTSTTDVRSVADVLAEYRNQKNSTPAGAGSLWSQQHEDLVRRLKLA